ncbi:hypothetical protein RJ639_037034, partial [Escallonia herrerae]
WKGGSIKSSGFLWNILKSSFLIFCYAYREELKFGELGLEILSIALPAALALAADPITSLVDTAFVGHLGSVELAAVGVSISLFNLVSKLFNVPLLNITTSFVAEEQALVTNGDNEPFQVGQGHVADYQTKKLLPSVSTSLALATAVGVAEAFALSVGSGFLMNSMGILVDSPMRVPAEQFLTLRAFGAPPIVIALAAQGTFRGFRDTKTPLYAIGKCAGNLLNAILDPILIFLFHLGIGGAAIATVISEYVNDVVKLMHIFLYSMHITFCESKIMFHCSHGLQNFHFVFRYLIAFILLWKLNNKVVLISPKIDGERVSRYLKSGGLLIARTLGVLLTTTLATSMAAREGPIPMAGYQICLQVWLALSLLTDALALAGQSKVNYNAVILLPPPPPPGPPLQAILASSYSQGNYEQARRVIYRVLQLGLAAGVSLAVILFFGFGAVSSFFTSDSEVLEIARSGTLFVAGSQPMNALAFVLDGLYYGVSDFGYAAYSMLLIGVASSVFLIFAAPVFGLDGVWAGLFLFMTLRVVAGVWR